VAGAAGFTPGDAGHGDLRAARLHFEQAVMAGVTTKIDPMHPVRENSWRKRSAAICTGTFELDVTGGRNQARRDHQDQQGQPGKYGFQ